MRWFTTLLGGLTVAGVATVGGTALTAANTGQSSRTLGFSTVTINSGQIDDLNFTVDPATDNLTAVTLVMHGDTHLSTASIGYNALALVACDAGVFDNGTPGSTSYTCDNAAPIAVSTVTAVRVALNED